MNTILRYAGVAASLLTLWFLARADSPKLAIQLSLCAAYFIHITISAYRSPR